MESPLNFPSLTLLVFQDCGELYSPTLQQESPRREPVSPDRFQTPRGRASGLTSARQEEDSKEYFR